MNTQRMSPKTVADLVNHVSSGFAGILHTDQELFEKINEHLPPHLQVCYRTFQRYKAAAMQYGARAIDGQKQYNSVYADSYQAFLQAGMRQKETLVNKMLEAEGNKWQRYKWLLEKKFPEFNQACIMEKFRRENSYLDEDYPVYQAKKSKRSEPQQAFEKDPEPITNTEQEPVQEQVDSMPETKEDVAVPAIAPAPVPATPVVKTQPQHVHTVNGSKKAKHKRFKVLRMA